MEDINRGAPTAGHPTLIKQHHKHTSTVVRTATLLSFFFNGVAMHTRSDWRISQELFSNWPACLIEVQGSAESSRSVNGRKAGAAIVGGCKTDLENNPDNRFKLFLPRSNESCARDRGTMVYRSRPRANFSTLSTLEVLSTLVFEFTRHFERFEAVASFKSILKSELFFVLFLYAVCFMGKFGFIMEGA